MLAAYWIQFMTHDWFSHMEEGHNAPAYMKVGCATKLVNNVETPLTPEADSAAGLPARRPLDKGYVRTGFRRPERSPSAARLSDARAENLQQ